MLLKADAYFSTAAYRQPETRGGEQHAIAPNQSLAIEPSQPIVGEYDDVGMPAGLQGANSGRQGPFRTDGKLV